MNPAPPRLGASPRILFYPHSARALTSSLIGHLYEVSQQYSVVLLTEPLPEAYMAHLRNRNVFPGLERVELVQTLGFTIPALVSQHRRWLRLAREAMETVAPALVIGENDMSSLFDMYLLREAKRRGVPTLTIQSMGQVREGPFRESAEFQAVCLGRQVPAASVALARRWRYRARKELGHVLVHYLLPWSASQPALRGASSYVRRAGVPGMRDTDLHLVQSLPQLKVFTEAGVSLDRLAILRHPMARIPRDAFFPPQVTAARADQARPRRILVLLTTWEMGLERGAKRTILRQARRELRLAILRAIRDTLSGWEILVKAHPDFGSVKAVRAYLGDGIPDLSVADPAHPVEPYLPSCDAILDLPPPATSVLATAVSASPSMPAIAADLDHDLIGDQYRDWPEIDYVDSLAALRSLLSAIQHGRYRKRPLPSDNGVGVRRFGDTCQAVRFSLERHDA